METNDPSGRLTAEDLSDCISDSSHSESQLRAFQSYERIKELNLTIDKTKEDASTEAKDFHLSVEGGGRTSLRFDEFSCENQTRNLTMTLKTKDFGYSANNLNEINYSLDRSNENEESADVATTLCRSKSSSNKNALFNLRETKQRSPHASLSSLDRYSKDLNFVVEKEMKEFGLLKNYNLDRMKEFNFSLDRMRDSHISSLALERLRGGAGLLENPGMLEHKEFRNLQVQPRNPDLEAIALERMRRSHLLGSELSAQNLSTQVPHPHSITHMQHSQQQQQQQAKSFTIDAILGLRNNQREKRSQQQQYRKHQGQEGSTKNSSSSSGSGGGGKVKRVRTIFTAEQLERLEGEFARQQYMVGPERLYLAHALRLTEAQVKVWFQNRRIKWRKLHHEQQSQRVHEFQRTLNSSLEHEDSNETDKCFLTRMEQIGRNKTKYASPHTTTWPTKQITDARVPPETYWKYTQRNNQDTTDKNTRRHQSPMPEPTVSYYSSANSYKTLKHNSYPYSTHLKHSSALHTEAPQRYQQTTKSGRNKDCNNNIAVINKDRYKTQEEDGNNAEYIDEELGNFTEDNLEEDAEEEAENDQERAGEPLDKEYDEQEADDEIDEESDAPVEPHVMQRNAAKKDALLRAQQRMRMINQQDPHRIRYSQYLPKLYEAHPLSTRYYHGIRDHDVHEALSEEDLYTAQALKNPPRRSSAGYHQNWIPQRSSADRYDTMASLTHPSRRARTRPEIKSFTEAEFTERRKCSRCGNVSTRKPSTSRRNNCRFQDNPNFSTKERFGDDAEILDQSWCGHCKPKRHLEESIEHCEIPSPALYSMKLRRSKDTNIPMHETLEGKYAMDEISHKFARMPSRYTKDTSNTLRDRTRHSVQTPQGPTRMSVRYNL